MSAFLPQQQSFLGKWKRKLELRWHRRWYKYDYTHVAPLAILKDLPIVDQFSFEWMVIVAKKVLAVLANRAALEGDARAKTVQEAKQSELTQLLKKGPSGILELRNLIHQALHFDGRFGAPAKHAQTLEEYADVFRAIGLPPIAKDYADDRAFAAMRVAGPNPVMLRRLKKLDDRLPITNELFQQAVPQDSLEAALAEGRLYLADYAVLDGAKWGNFPNGQKYVYAPLALFVITGPSKELLPVAIQCRQKPAPDNPIFTPKHGYNWLIAKTIVETADGNYHEAATHLGRTHLSIEPFVVSSHRQLAESHPLALLLWPHFEGTLAINKASWQHLIADKGGVDQLFGGTIETSRSVAVLGVQSLRVMNDLLPLTFQARDVADRDAFPVYPYRDDSMLYWDAIHEWVDTYLRLYYASDTDVQQDFELQAWGRELAADDGGRLKGLPGDGAIQRLADLIEVVTFVIYTCSVQHAAVNFPQYDHMSYVPNMPLAGYRPAPTSQTGATEADYIAMLPTMDMAELQMELGFMLGTVHYTELGRYEERHFSDARVTAPLKRFQQKLSDIGRTIAQRNQSRRSYEILAPQGVPQSINI